MPAKARPSKEKRSFENRELFLRNLTWNIESKHSKVNEIAVTLIFLGKSTVSITKVKYTFTYFSYFKTVHHDAKTNA